MAKTKEVLPCGILDTTNQKRYWLLKPYPIVGDSWEGDNCYRWLVTPIDPNSFNPMIYPSVRHVVSNSFSIEYMTNLVPILVEVQEEETDD